jgi:hypothetical protein
VPLTVPRQTIERFSACCDPDELRQEIWETLGRTYIDGVHIMFNRVLLAIYIAPERSKGGIYRTSTSKEEDLWQGKVGLVVGLGPDAFVDDPTHGVLFNNQRANIGEWVVFKVGDTWDMVINDVACRLVEDANIKMKLKDPRLVV